MKGRGGEQRPVPCILTCHFASFPRGNERVQCGACLSLFFLADLANLAFMIACLARGNQKQVWSISRLSLSLTWFSSLVGYHRSV